MYPVFQFATLFILTLAANTSYSDFPRLSSLLARDHFLPHQFAFRGDRLAFSTGIIFLAILASILLVMFNGIQPCSLTYMPWVSLCHLRCHKEVWFVTGGT